jgi:hypothetical protein
MHSVLPRTTCPHATAPGELIRPRVSDERERRLYDKIVGAGTYIFALSDSFHVDATRAGNMAHLLNHSCDPNCYRCGRQHGAAAGHGCWVAWRHLIMCGHSAPGCTPDDGVGVADTSAGEGKARCARE